MCWKKGNKNMREQQFSALFRGEEGIVNRTFDEVLNIFLREEELDNKQSFNKTP
jgi:hypothetical protein